MSNASDENSPMLIAVSARSLFDMKEDTEFLEEHGLNEYRKHQKKMRNRPFKKGVAFTFVERMLALNNLSTDAKHPLVEVAILSHMDPDTGVRVMRTIDVLGMPMKMTVFTSGGSLSKYIKALGVDLYLSMSESSVKEAVDLGLPAGQILTDKPITEHDTGNGEIRLAFDFDGVIGDDSSEQVFQKEGLAAFEAHEKSLQNKPMDPGPLASFIKTMGRIQKAEDARIAETNGEYDRRLKISVVTSRGNPADIRVMKTMETWGISLDSAFFMNGHSKEPIIEALHPHLFFDDQSRHVDPVREIAPAVHVPFGVTNS